MTLTAEQMEILETRAREAHKKWEQENAERAKAMKFRKARNELRWMANNGTKIMYNHFYRNYTINKGSFFAFTATLDDAMNMARHDGRFNAQC